MVHSAPVPAATASVLTPAPALAPLAVPIAPLSTLVHALPIAPPALPAPPLPSPLPPPAPAPQEPLHIRSKIIANHQYEMNLRHRSLRTWVSTYNSKLEREEEKELRRQKKEQQRLEAENIALNMSLGRYDEESDTASLRHSLLGRKRKRWSYADGDTSNPLAPHLMVGISPEARSTMPLFT